VIAAIIEELLKAVFSVDPSSGNVWGFKTNETEGL
jgi:hypothetical protein